MGKHLVKRLMVVSIRPLSERIDAPDLIPSPTRRSWLPRYLVIAVGSSLAPYRSHQAHRSFLFAVIQHPSHALSTQAPGIFYIAGALCLIYLPIHGTHQPSQLRHPAWYRIQPGIYLSCHHQLSVSQSALHIPTPHPPLHPGLQRALGRTRS